jgi:hypothetical protein
MVSSAFGNWLESWAMVLHAEDIDKTPQTDVADSCDNQRWASTLISFVRRSLCTVLVVPGATLISTLGFVLFGGCADALAGF